MPLTVTLLTTDEHKCWQSNELLCILVSPALSVSQGTIALSRRRHRFKSGWGHHYLRDSDLSTEALQEAVSVLEAPKADSELVSIE